MSYGVACRSPLRSQRYLRRFDAVLCKTRYAVDLFNARGCRALYIGFRGTDSSRMSWLSPRWLSHASRLIRAMPILGQRMGGLRSCWPMLTARPNTRKR
jgi:hypothetical protein